MYAKGESYMRELTQENQNNFLKEDDFLDSLSGEST